MAIGVNEAAQFIARTFRPLRDWITDDHIKAYVERIGWTLPSVPSGFRNVRDSAAQLLDELANLMDADQQDDPLAFGTAVANVVSFVTVVVGNIDALPNSINAELPLTYRNETGIANNIRTRLLDQLLYDGIRLGSHTVKSILFALGILDEDVPDPAPHQPPQFVLHQVHLDRIGLLFRDPSALMTEVYGWGTADIKEERLFSAIQQLSFGLLGEPEVISPSPQFIQGMFPGVPIPPEGLGEMLAVSVMLGQERAPLLIGAIPAPKSTPSEPQAIALRVLGAPDLSFSVPVTSTVTLTLDSKFALDAGVGVILRPNEAPTIVQNVESAATPATEGRVGVTLRREDAAHPVRLFRFGKGADLRAKTFFAELSLQTPPSDLVIRAGIEGGVLTVSLADADGFVGSVVPAGALTINFDLGIGWSKTRGIFLTGSAGLETLIVLNLTLGPVFLQAIRLAVKVADDALHAQAGLLVGVTLGPVTGVLEGVGVESLLRFKSGNLGPMDLGVEFLAPTGLGLSVDAGVVRGGGFLKFEDGRYSGAFELSVYKVAVKAFGLVETRLPDGRKGFSFVIVISAEFTPIQLGFGFTLLGVGGLIGINRSVVSDALGDAVRSGSLDHLLFPRNPIRDAPAIINDLATIFPAAPGHYVFGPMAKLGWGTPTLVTANLGIVLELPGPRLAVLGAVHVALPTEQVGIVRLNLGVAGFLDFPRQLFSLDASLYDSSVGGFPVSGDMAFRLNFGDRPNFALGVGGFNPSFQAPPGFPELRRAAVDLGANGNPSLTMEGYLAITSNTAQIGAGIYLHASGAGIDLDGHVAFDALFVFSPFSFEASFDAGVSVSFHGVGFGVGLHGVLSGPSPWRVQGEVCVSILWWDACLGFDASFGGTVRAELPPVDPWTGPQPQDATQLVIGLQTAVQDARNWSGSTPPGAFSVISLAETSRPTPPIDPVGAATLRQKTVPLNRKITKFGEFRPAVHDEFDLDSIAVGGEVIDGTSVQTVKDDFAPANFKDMSAAERLSASPYEPMDAGFTIAPDLVKVGSVAENPIVYKTLLLDAQRKAVPGEVDFTLTRRHLVGMLQRSAAGLEGVRRTGLERYASRAPVKVKLAGEGFAIANACDGTPNLALTGGAPTTRTAATLALETHLETHPEDFQRFTAVPAFELGL
jgi:hypothetical protein